MTKKNFNLGGQANQRALFWVVFGVVAVGLVLLVASSYRPQVQPKAADEGVDLNRDIFCETDETPEPPAPDQSAPVGSAPKSLAPEKDSAPAVNPPRFLAPESRQAPAGDAPASGFSY